MNRPRVVLLVHGGPESIEAVRARGLIQDYPSDQIQLLFREGSRRATTAHWHRDIKRFEPDLLYVINTALPGCPMACWCKLAHGLPFILDTGDAVFAMARSAGSVSTVKLPFFYLTESLTQNLARTIVVRGTRHQEFLRNQGYPNVALIRDGCHPVTALDEAAVGALRKQLGLNDSFVVGLMGSLVYSPRLGICYGWDLIQALSHLRDFPIKGLMIGDGAGRSWLESQARSHGVADRIVFCGRIPYAEVPLYLNLLDVALSTQTNNLPGQVRTTGKLPEYMAAGRFILASRVGEAALVLPETMLLDYHGDVDPKYPERLATRLREFQGHPALLEPRHDLPAKAEKLFSYPVLSRLFRETVQSAI